MSNIKYVNGDILSPNTNRDRAVVVCHQVNCMGKMGAGLAKQVAATFPGVYSVYKEKCKAFGVKNLGDIQLCSCEVERGYIIANVFGQENFGREKQHTDYGALRMAFFKLSRMENTTIRIPYMMGCGLGGGDWRIVLDIIAEELADKGCDVEIWRKD